MKPAPFSYHRARSVAEAVDLLATVVGARVIAGGQSLMQQMLLRTARPTLLVDISSLKGLAELRLSGDGLTSGALVTHRAVEKASLPDDGFAAIRDAVPLIGNIPVRNRGTVVGSLCFAQPRAEWVMLARLWNATLDVATPEGQRKVRMSDFLVGEGETSLVPGDLVTGVHFDRVFDKSGFAEHSRRYGDLCLAGVAAGVRVEGAVIRSAKISVGGTARIPAVWELDFLTDRTAAVTDAPPTYWRDLAGEVTDLARVSDAALHTHQVRWVGGLAARALRQALTSEGA